MRCPVCKGEKVYRVWIDIWTNGFEKRIFKCTECGLGFTHPLPSLDDLRTMYSDASYFFGQTDSLGYKNYDPPTGWFYELLRQMIRFNATSPLLDVGTATGTFLLMARKRGLDGFGVEPSKWAADQARRLGVQTMIGLFEEIAPKLSSESLGSISMSHTIEHFADPFVVLRECFRLLRLGGVLGILTVNFASPRWRNPEKAYLVSREHLFYFTPKSLRLMVEQAGFKICYLATLPSPSPKAWLMGERFSGRSVSLLRLVSKWTTWLYKGILRRALNPNQWSDMILVARKGS